MSEAAFDHILEEPLPEPVPPRGPAFGEFRHDASGRRLLVMVEPVAMTAAAHELATRIVEAAGSRFRAQPLMALRDIVVDCCENATRVIGSAVSHALRHAGVVAAILDGEQLVIARAAPGAVLLVQDGDVFAHPALARKPTGKHDESENPKDDDEEYALLVVNFQPGDMLVLCSSALHHGLSQAASAAKVEQAALATGLLGKINDVLAGFEEIAAEFELGQAAGALLYSATSNDAVTWKPSNYIPPVDEAAKLSSSPSPIVSIRGGTSSENPAGEGNDEHDERTTSWAVTPFEPLGVASRDELSGESRFERFHTRLLNAFENYSPKRNALASAFGSQATVHVPLGARSVHVYRSMHDGSTFMGLRSNLPRGPRVHIPTKVLSMVLALLVLAASLGFLYNRRAGRADAADAAINAVDVQLASASYETNAVTIAAELSLAEQALAKAEKNGASAKVLESRYRALTSVRDRASGIVRLTNVTRIGTLPANVAAKKPRLVRQGNDVYVVGGGFYEVDPATKSLNMLLYPDKKISGGRLGELIGASADKAGLTLTDGQAIFRTGKTGKWKRMEIGTIGKNVPWDAGICGYFDGSFYVLNVATGQILKFDSEHLTAVPDSWTESTAAVELTHGRDMVVDSSIFVLLDDGRVLKFYRGALDSNFSSEVPKGVSDPTVLDSSADENFMYLADRADGSGRISRLDAQGILSKEYLLPGPEQDGYVAGAAFAFGQIDDLVVNERTGQIVILSGDQIWSATIPGDSQAT
ncbi:MAG: hypothetical protein ACJ789_00170 [Thermomicrobiales bacterium]